MKEENINSIYRSLAGTDLTIEDTGKFLEFVSQTGLGVEEATQNIKVAKEKADKKIDYSEFERKLVDYFKNIQSEINKDGLFQYSDEKDIEEFRKFFQEIVDKNIIIYKLKDDKDECQRKLTEIENIKNEISSLNKTSYTISSDDLKKINDLNFKLGVKNLEYKKVLDLIEEDVKIITKNSNKQEFIVLVSSLNKDLNELTIIMDRLSLTSRTKTIVQKLFTSLIDELTEIKNLHTKEIKDFTNLCLAAGITGPSLQKEDIVIYNGSKPLFGNDYTSLLEEGKEYKVNRSIFKNNGLEEFYIEGFDEPFSVILFDTEKIWKEHMNGLITQMVTKVDTKSINKEEVYANAVIGLSKKNVSFNLKRAIATLLRKAKDKIDKLKETLSEKLRPDFESKYISDFMAIDADYEEFDDDIIDMNEFSKSFDEIKKEESKSKKR